jgi:hypothetical protein
MSQISKSRGSPIASIFMAGSKGAPPKYEPLRHDQDSTNIPTEESITRNEDFPANKNKQFSHSLLICIGICCTCLLFNFIILGTSGVLLQKLLSKTQHTHYHTNSSPSRDLDSSKSRIQRCSFQESGHQGCGHSPQEAVANGCIFDDMTTSWQYPDCFDAELNAEQTSLHTPLPFYWSSGPPDERPTAEMLNLIPLEELGFCEGTFWATREYHVWHCTYAWRQTHRAVEQGRKLDRFLLNYEHTAHFGRLLINATHASDIAMDTPVTQATLKYPLC